MEECKGQNLEDCYKCGKYYSSHSLHYDKVYKKKVVEITCSIGNYRVFDEQDDWINLDKR